MTAELVPFAFGDNLVRVHMDENDNPWWVAKDCMPGAGHCQQP